MKSDYKSFVSMLKMVTIGAKTLSFSYKLEAEGTAAQNKDKSQEDSSGHVG